MKRKEIVVGQEYRTKDFLRVRVLDTEPGWRVNDGVWVRDLGERHRYMPGKGYQPYQTNTAIKTMWKSAQGEFPVAVEPRDLVCTWAEHEAHVQAAQAVAKSAHDQEQALQPMFDALGVEPDGIDIKNGTCIVTLDSLKRLHQRLETVS